MYLVHRSGYDGPLSKRVVQLPDPTVLGWFQRVWNRPEPREWIPAELGRVYGFATIFETGPIRTRWSSAPSTGSPSTA